MSINSPDELLKKIQSLPGKNVFNKIPFENEEYQRELEKKIKAMNYSPDDFKGGIDGLITKFWEDIEMLDEDEVILIKEKIAIGNVRIDTIRTRLVSENGYHAIIFNHGLFMYLNKNLKLSYASVCPQDVIYCNRISEDEYSGEIFKSFRDELSKIYKHSQSVMGAMVLLKPDVYIVGQQLEFMELFILCHELGHFINGDADDLKKNVSLNKLDEKISDDEVSQMREFNADFTGFQLLIKILIKKNKLGKNSIHPSLILNFLILNFNIFTELAPENLKSHPHPIDRLLTLVLNVYGQDAAEFIEKTYEQRNYTIENKDKMFEIASRLNELFENS